MTNNPYLIYCYHYCYNIHLMCGHSKAFDVPYTVVDFLKLATEHRLHSTSDVSRGSLAHDLQK